MGRGRKRKCRECECEFDNEEWYCPECYTEWTGKPQAKRPREYGELPEKYSGEREFRRTCESYGLTVWKTDDDFSRGLAIMSEQERERHLTSVAIPWNEEDTIACEAYTDKKGEQKCFTIDFYLPQAEMMVELKRCTKTGTTEEKVFFDLDKIDKEYLSTGKHLLYYIYGETANDARLRRFQRRCEQHDNVTVIIEPTDAIEPAIEFIMDRMNNLTACVGVPMIA